VTGDKFIKKLILSSSTILIIIILDQISKNFAQRYFEITCNRGIAFGLSLGSLPLVLAVLLSVFFLFWKEKTKVIFLPLALILGGGISNVFDRLTIGCVRDFINIGFWPSFNLADGAITLGVLLSLLEVFLNRQWQRS